MAISNERVAEILTHIGSVDSGDAARLSPPPRNEVEMSAACDMGAAALSEVARMKAERDELVEALRGLFTAARRFQASRDCKHFPHISPSCDACALTAAFTPTYRWAT